MSDSANLRAIHADLVGMGDRSWGGMCLVGVVSVLSGIFLGVRPRASIDGITVIVGLFLITNGLVRMVAAMADGQGPVLTRAVISLLGAVSMAIGVLFLRDTGRSVSTVASLVGLAWVVGGVLELVSTSSRQGVEGNRFRLSLALLAVVAGLVTLVVPSLTLVTLATITAVWLVVYGVLQIVTALVLRRLIASQR
jgi:uncharacterized membrane protein HdeD (DUF308 family)